MIDQQCLSLNFGTHILKMEVSKNTENINTNIYKREKFEEGGEESATHALEAQGSAPTISPHGFNLKSSKGASFMRTYLQKLGSRCMNSIGYG